MTRRIPALALLTLLTLSLGCGGGGGGGGGPPPVWQGFSTGSAVWNGTLGVDGCFPHDVILEANPGLSVSLLVTRGTCLRTVRGTRVTGPIALGLDDSGGGDALTNDPTLEGVVRPYVLQAGALVDARFDPPARLIMEISDWSTPGVWQLFTNQAAGVRVLGPLPSNLAGPGNAGDTILLGGIQTENFGPEVFDVPQVGPLGFEFEAFPEDSIQPKPASAPVFSTTSTRDIPLPGATGAEWPKVYSWRLVNPDTAEIVALGLIEGGMTSGQSQTVMFQGNTYTAAVVSDGMGGRKLEITTNVSNKFRYELWLCNEDGTTVHPDGDASGGSADEADAGGTYAGSIEIDVTGWGGVTEFDKVFDEIEDELIEPEYVVEDFFNKGSGDRWFGRFAVFGHSMSANALAAGLPAGWQVTVGNRHIKIVIPCPPPTVVVTTPSTMAVTTLNPTTFAPLDSELIVPVILDFAVQPNGELLAASSAGMLHIVDLTTPGPSTQSVAVPGLTGAVALSPRDDCAYVATDTGRFEAYDLDTATLQWFIDTLPMETYTSMCVAPDGSFAYCSAPGSEVIVEIDLVAQAPGRELLVPGSDQVNIASTGLELCVVDADAGGIRIADLLDEIVSDLIPTHTTPTEAIWTALDEHIAAAGDTSVKLVDPKLKITVGEFPLGALPTSITDILEGEDHPVEVLATVPSATSIWTFDIKVDADPPVMIDLTPEPAADRIRTNGR